MNRRRNDTARKGFTMVELMAILVILGLLAAVGSRAVISRIDTARVTTTKANLRILHNAVTDFYMDMGRYPSEDVGLVELIEQPPDAFNWQPYLETTELPKDAWGEEFIYERYPPSGRPFVIKSLGADRKEGGEGLDADLLSTD